MHTSSLLRMLPAAVFLVLLAGRATAHPHVWIDVAMEVVFEQGKVTALRQIWLFDDYYTAYATEGMDGDGDGQPDAARLQELLKENMGNLEEYGYFTEVTSGGSVVPFGPVVEMASRMTAARLEMTFLLPLAVPLDVRDRGMAYAIFDPTYYIEMLHAERTDAVRLSAAPAGCSAHLQKPDPTVEATSLAAALDRTQSAGNGLGGLFAERVTVRCP